MRSYKIIYPFNLSNSLHWPFLSIFLPLPFFFFPFFSHSIPLLFRVCWDARRRRERKISPIQILPSTLSSSHSSLVLHHTSRHFSREFPKERAKTREKGVGRGWWEEVICDLCTVEFTYEGHNLVQFLRRFTGCPQDAETRDQKCSDQAFIQCLGSLSRRHWTLQGTWIHDQQTVREEINYPLSEDRCETISIVKHTKRTLTVPLNAAKLNGNDKWLNNCAFSFNEDTGFVEFDKPSVGDDKVGIEMVSTTGKLIDLWSLNSVFGPPSQTSLSPSHLHSKRIEILVQQ